MTEQKTAADLSPENGRFVAIEAALRTPDNIADLVLVCPVMNILPDDYVQASNSVPLRFTWLGEMLVSAAITNPLLTGILPKQFMHNTQALSQRHIEILQRPMSRTGNTSHMVSWLQQFLKGDPDAKSRNKIFLKKLQTPVSLIWGTKDTVTPIEQGDVLSKLVQPVRFTRLNGVGHMPQLEKPDFASDLIKSLRDIQALQEQ